MKFLRVILRFFIGVLNKSLYLLYIFFAKIVFILAIKAVKGRIFNVHYEKKTWSSKF